MAFELSLFSDVTMQKQSVDEVMRCNESTAHFGLELTHQQALALVETRSFALKQNGRIEFGGGVIDKIINEFCDSPHMSMPCYEETLHELLEMFYYYKNETFDMISDDTLIKYMKNVFDSVCQGSLELLGRELYKLAENLRYGRAPDNSDDALDPDAEGEHGEY